MIDKQNEVILKIEEIEKEFIKFNKLDISHIASRIINNCCYILDGIDARNEQRRKGTEKEKYPQWANKQNIKLIEEWSKLQKKLKQETQEENEEEFLS